MKCIHCLKESENITKDHVFPRSWYTDDTPSWIQRWTAPSCSECNQKFGKMEQDLFVKLAACIDPHKAEASGINNKLKKTFAKRPHFTRSLLAELRPYTKGKKVFPGLGPHSNFPIESQLYIPAPTELIPVLEKIFRGVEYVMAGEYIEYPYKLKIYHIEKEPQEIKNIFNQCGQKEILGPGFKIERAVPTGIKRPVIYKQTTWGTIVSYASIFEDNK